MFIKIDERKKKANNNDDDDSSDSSSSEKELSEIGDYSIVEVSCDCKSTCYTRRCKCKLLNLKCNEHCHPKNKTCVNIK